MQGKTTAAINPFIGCRDVAGFALMAVHVCDGRSKQQAQARAAGFEVDTLVGAGIATQHEIGIAAPVFLHEQRTISVGSIGAVPDPVLCIFLGVIDHAIDDAGDEFAVEKAH